MADEAWPVVLLVLRLGAVVVLYVFLFAGFRALRWELGAPARQRAGQPVDMRGTAPAAPPTPGPATPPVTPPAIAPPPEAVPGGEQAAGGAARARRRPAVRLALAIPALASAVVLAGSVAVLAAREGQAGPGVVTAVPEGQEFGPPTQKPAPGRVTVGLAAQEDTLVRVTVDGVVQFDGTLRARQRQAWEGSQRVQVWTDKGKTLLIAINGEDLGPYSPAMGHPDWNRIDFGFIPGWTRANGLGG